jgi:hypothetical protein
MRGSRSHDSLWSATLKLIEELVLDSHLFHHLRPNAELIFLQQVAKLIAIVLAPKRRARDPRRSAGIGRPQLLSVT